MKQTYWFAHDSNARNDTKILAIESLYPSGYGWFFKVVEMLREQADYKLPVNKFTIIALAVQLKTTAETAGKFLEDCKEIGLFTGDDKSLWSESLLERMAGFDNRVKSGRESAIKMWQDRKLKATHRQPTTKTAKTEETLEEYKAKLKMEYPELDFDNEVKKWETWWSENKTPLKRPKTALRNWLDKAREIKKKNNPAKVWNPRG